MSIPIESQFYECDYRAVHREGAIKVYSSSACIETRDPISFDREVRRASSFDMLASSIVSEILINMISTFEGAGEELLDLECKAQVSLANPLTLANVKGYEEIPKIDNVKCKIYFYSFLDAEQASNLFERSLHKCPIYQTLKDTLSISIELSQLY